ncbi:MAG: DIP1984 family protein [Clostridia bacterium]|nr:DIP1984 family protein [Clostridia bacterium]
MKLAEALQERADLQRNIENLRERLENVMLVQEGEKPVEDPAELLTNLEEAVSRLEYLIAAINHTNDSTVIREMTLTQIIAKKDTLNLKLSVYKGLVAEAGCNTNRARGTEIKVLPTVNVALMQKKADGIAKEIRLLDNLLQETNWTCELKE